MPDARALIVDVGGVLTTPVLGSFGAFCDAEGIALDDLRTVLGDIFRPSGDDHPIARLETGRMPLSEFEPWLANEIAAGCGKQVAVDGVAHRLVGTVELEQRMFDAVRLARAAGHPTGLLSNSWGRTDYGMLTDLFDAVVISGAEGMRKPDADIYRLAIERIGVPAESCVFVDDVARNCEGAVAVGMHAVHHADPDVTIPKLETLLGVALR